MSTKESIAKILKTSNDFVSGEELAQKCGVSRASIWKAVKALESEGWLIDAVTNRGYKIKAEPDHVTSEGISGFLKELGADFSFVLGTDSIDSTNSEAKRRAAEAGAFRNESGELTPSGKNLHKALFAAGQQTAGRGRMGRPFVSPPNTGVYFTVIYSPKKGVQNPALLTAAAAVAVAQTVDELYGTDCKIKWVNDVFANGKKISGILTEGFSNFETGRIEAAVVGIGINIRKNDFGGDLAKVAGSIQDALESDMKEFKAVPRNHLVAGVCARLIHFYDSFESDSQNSGEIEKMIENYQKRSLLTGKIVTVHPSAGIGGGEYLAKVIGIDKQARLLVRLDSGKEMALQSGEVSLHSYDFTV